VGTKCSVPSFVATLTILGASRVKNRELREKKAQLERLKEQQEPLAAK